jgi:DNA-binding CsgD family transcriptional regulator
VETVIADLYEAAMLPEFWPTALDGFARMTGSRGALITRADRDHDGLMCSAGINDSVAAFFEGGWQTRDIRTTGAIRQGDSGFVADQHIISADEIKCSEYYTGFARRQDVPWFAAAGILQKGMPMVGLSFQRTAVQGAFSATELERLDRILPRVKHVLSTGYRMARAGDRTLMNGLGAFGDAVIMLGPGGMEIDCNEAAHDLIGDGLVRFGHGVRATHPQARDALRSLIEKACRADDDCPTTHLKLPRRLGGPLLVQAAPVVGRARDLFGQARAFLILTEQGEGAVVDPGVLAALFGLTPAQARVATALVAGHSVRQISEDQDISEAAVRFHLKSILPKAGVHRQAEFVAKVAALGLHSRF